ncbi:hypothetical protein H4R33_005387 [Dimargaris cristalligena]|nr:hypothetical protein H4R33_005387 [Dimargaris cristalligena]
MAKKKSASSQSKGQASEPAKPIAKQTSTEIDDIFAAKSTKPASKSKSKSKSKTKHSSASSKETNPGSNPASVNADVDVEVGVDAGADNTTATVTTKPTKVTSKAKPTESTKRKATSAFKDDDGFFDTRGTRTKQKTVDGYHIYTLTDLKIGQGGDTAECPFDCECCF